MKKIVTLLPLFFLSLVARENPFFPIDDMQELSYTTNDVEKIEPLKRVAISFPHSARIIKKVIIEYQNLDGTLESKYIDLDYAVDWHLPLFVSQSYDTSLKKTATKQRAKRASFAYSQFDFFDKKLEIQTSDKMIRAFMLSDPQRLVIDFKREANFLTWHQNINSSIFKELSIGNHNGYYRCVLTLDAQYTYILDKDGTNIRVEFH